MKKGLLLILGTAFIASMCFTSCKKDYTCTCTYTDAAMGGPDVYPLNKQKKKDAKSACDVFNAAASALNGSCVLK